MATNLAGAGWSGVASGAYGAGYGASFKSAPSAPSAPSAGTSVGGGGGYAAVSAPSTSVPSGWELATPQGLATFKAGLASGKTVQEATAAGITAGKGYTSPLTSIPGISYYTSEGIPITTLPVTTGTPAVAQPSGEFDLENYLKQFVPKDIEDTEEFYVPTLDRWEFVTDPNTGYIYVVKYDQKGKVFGDIEIVGKRESSTDLTPYEKEALALRQRELEAERQRAQAELQASQGITEYQRQYLALQRQELAAATAQKEWEKTHAAEQLTFQQQQAQWEREQVEKQYKSQLAASPKSWLEYAAYTGQQPVVQPWMLPLMQEQYGFNAGGAIPGWTAQNMQNIPSLLTPSAQYLARMGPTAQQQYYGYQQAQTGASPEETQWRLWSAAPPGGQFTGLNYAY